MLENCRFYLSSGLSHGDLPDTDGVVGVTSEERLSVGRPRKRDAFVLVALGGRRDDLRSELIHLALVLQVLHKAI